MTVNEAVRQIRREAGRLARKLKDLEQIQDEIDAPPPDEVARTVQGQQPIGAGLHLIGLLQAALVGLEGVILDLRDGVRKDELLGLERDWQPGIRPEKAKLDRILAGLDARRATRRSKAVGRIEAGGERSGEQDLA
ncbi:MAG TPA: hypothetical protein VGX68_02325 [Thermoanaerobaculia bacterium]|jgi:hypothetical protein|nr:hypothetical protein [Thermoanaerobaculia bacterium]